MMTMMNFQRRSWSNWGLHCDRLDAGEDEAGLHHRHHHHYHQRCHYDHYDHQNNNNGHNNRKRPWMCMGTSHVFEHRGTTWWVDSYTFITYL